MTPMVSRTSGTISVSFVANPSPAAVPASTITSTRSPARTNSAIAAKNRASITMSFDAVAALWNTMSGEPITIAPPASVTSGMPRARPMHHDACSAKNIQSRFVTGARMSRWNGNARNATNSSELAGSNGVSLPGVV